MVSPSIASATRPDRVTWRTIARLTLMVLALLFLIVPHLLYRAVGRPSPMVMAFLNAVGWIAGLRIRTTGTRLRRDVLFVSNHVSWLDILALGGAARSAFVSKAEVKTTPLVGWLADQNSTIYVQREAKRDIHSQANSLRDALARGRPVTLFPEGTTGPGDGLLPFRASLFQAIIPTPPNLRVQPVFLDYGPQASDIAWLDPESGLGNFKRLLARKRVIPLTIHYLDPLPDQAEQDRKAINEAARAAIAAEIVAASAAPRHRL
ncbi:1-acyl-sn-glycerol-3-phosphate acyltransferase [Sphingopyxis sp. BE122]|jgi:lyso-ornithine lipid O-acyltransferase|uniref:lysophospholipid acyltransferase family protein n=1 Tax=Sphingopyxis sp. BE122 TaxID=2817841 RepID=UPI002861EDA0|nr:lysophospholipid acyltransferase family protein [Sphingopyxis sp. BE122]MDR6832484.1 1-acyl-sn-glycerol-3-phosphate acyltransferase [Sphingopyxis sp. BE122]